MRKLIFMFGLLTLSISTLSQEVMYKTFDNHRVHYSAFNSSFLTSEVASIYNITRGKDKGVVNIAVVPTGMPHGITALVNGTVNNLLAQQQTLVFDEIREGDAVYYIAPFNFDNEDPLTFNINVRPAGTDRTFSFTFQRTLYQDE